MAPIIPSPEGYPKLAKRMGSASEFAIFRRFAGLNARNLLYLQAELSLLEKRLEDLTAADEQVTSGDRAIYSRDWETLKASCDGGIENNSDSSKQWKLFLDIRTKLKEYNETLFLQSQLTRLEQPNPQDIGKLTTWMGSTTMGNVFLIGQDSDIWESEKTRNDLVAWKVSKADDSLTRWIFEGAAQEWHYWVGHYFKKPKPDQDPAFVTYSNQSIAAFQRVVTTLVSCLLPVLAIVILYFVPQLPKRLGILAGLVVGFSGCLLWLTNAGGGDIFAATAAFTAVLVVFVGSTSSSSAPAPLMAVLYNCTTLGGNCTAIVQ